MAIKEATKEKKSPAEKSEKIEQERASHPVKGQQVKAGDLMAFTYYALVRGVRSGGTNLECTGLDPGVDAFSVQGQALVENSASADQFYEEKPATKTELAKLLVGSVNRPLTVWFVKQDGELRKLRGRLLGAEPLLGRSHVEDLDLPMNKGKEGRRRLVDHRTLQALIVDGVKYALKG